jgi:hypothetical protein
MEKRHQSKKTTVMGKNMGELDSTEEELKFTQEKREDETVTGSERYDLHVISGVKVVEGEVVLPALCRQVKRLSEEVGRLVVTHEAMKVTVDIRDVFRRIRRLESLVGSQEGAPEPDDEVVVPKKKTAHSIAVVLITIAVAFSAWGIAWHCNFGG